MARLCSLGAVTSIPTYPSSGYTNRPRCSVEWGQRVDERIYPQMGHTVNRDELDAVDALLSKKP